MDPFVYQYTVGGIVFGVGLLYAYRQGFVGLSGQPARNLALAVGGLLAFMGLQGWLQYGSMTEAPAVPYTGDGLDEGVIGTSIDYAVMVGYFVVILGIGTWFGRGQQSTKDFFFGGQRFSWWLIAFSLVASTIGSYSFVKYSRVAYGYGLASSQTYLNDWFWLPLLLFGWLPLLYFSRLTSIPEYFERRFGRAARNTVTVLLLLYLVGYVGVNLFTMGKALNILLGWPVFWAAAAVASVSAVYVTMGGQTSVIMTDLFQGVMLLAVGLILLYFGAQALGGADQLWEHLPREHRRAFPNFNTDPSYNAAGIFWQDAMANSAMFYFLNQGILMRFMAARSVQDGRRAAASMFLVLMPVAAVVVASGGWVGKAMEHAGLLPPGIDGGAVFFVAAEQLARPGLFGLVMAALTAALMSTVDTLITAVAAIVVNDVVKPMRPRATEAELLRAARIASVCVALVGVALVPVFMGFKSIYEAHAAFTAAITPPLVIALLFSVFWRRFTKQAAMATMIGGTAAIAASIFFPELVAPFAHGVPAADAGEGLFAGAKQYKFMRAFYGLSVSAVIGVVVALVTRPESEESQRGLVWGTVADALRHYKGSDGEERWGPWVGGAVRRGDDDQTRGAAGLPVARVSASLANRLHAARGDVVYIADRRAWLGGLRSSHAIIESVVEEPGEWVELGPRAYAALVAPGRDGQPVRMQRLY